MSLKTDTLTLNVKNLDCAHCASLIEQDIDSLDNVETCNINFINKTLLINFKTEIDADETILYLQKVIDKVEDGLILENIQENSSCMLKLENLDCAHCASLIEDSLSNLDIVKSFNLNFINKTLTVDFYNMQNINDKVEKIKSTILKIEPQIKISNITKNENIQSNNKLLNFRLISILVGGAFFVFASFTNSLIIYAIAYIILGYDILFKAIKNVANRKLFDENFLMTIATIGAIVIKEFSEAVAIMLFYQVGEYFQEKAVSRSRKAIKSLLDIKAEYATLENGEKVAPESVFIDDIIIVKAGEKVPLDGIVIEGSSFLDMSALIGESVLKKVNIGDEILSGSINNNNILKIKVTKEYKNSTVSKIIDLVENSSSKKSKPESFISKFAKVYTPIIVYLALFLAVVPPLFTGFDFASWIEKSLIFLVSSCPCALVVSVPLSFFSGIGTASKRGILIKGSGHMYDLTLLEKVVFDKTGTLTKGVFEINNIYLKDVEKTELLSILYNVEKLSNHPIATSIVKYCKKNNVVTDLSVTNLAEISGYGIKADVEGDSVLIGNYKLLDINNINYPTCDENGTIIYVALNGKYISTIVISDIIKEEAKDFITNLKSIGIKDIVMLSGDNKDKAQFVANKLNINTVYGELLPQDKVNKFEEIKNNTEGKVAFVGDGINDSPVLAMADVGISMGSIGSDVAIEASDIVIMNDNLNKIIDAITISKNTLSIVRVNIVFSLVVKLTVLILAVFGLATPWLAILADLGVSIIAILNAMRKKI